MSEHHKNATFFRKTFVFILSEKYLFNEKKSLFMMVPNQLDLTLLKQREQLFSNPMFLT